MDLIIKLLNKILIIQSERFKHNMKPFTVEPTYIPTLLRRAT